MDLDGDNRSTPAEFVDAGSRFNPPLSQANAEHVFSQLDDDGDGVASADDVERLVLARVPEAAAAGMEMTPADYRQGLARSARSLGVSMELSSFAPAELSPAELASVRRILVLSLAATAGVPLDAVTDLEGNRRSVSVYLPGDRGRPGVRALVPALRRTGSLVAAALVEQPQGTRIFGVDRSLNAQRASIARDLAAVPGVREAGAVSFAMLGSVAVHFLRADADGDGALDVREFAAVAEPFQEELEGHATLCLFHGLDADGSGALSLEEVAAEGLERFGLAPYFGRRIAFADFRARLLRAFGSPQEAYDAVAPGAGLGEWRALARRLRPALTAAQAEHTFHGLDADADGRLGNAEFLKAYRLADFGASAARVDAQFQGMRFLTPVALQEEQAAYSAEQAAASCALAMRVVGFVCGAYLLRTILVAGRLPGAVGAAAAGAALGACGTDLGPLLRSGGAAQELLSSLALYILGFGLSLPDLSPWVAAGALAPWALELGVAALCLALTSDLGLARSLLVAACVCGGSVRLAAPALSDEAGGGTLPGFVSRCAPAEACVATCLWALLSSLVFEEGPSPSVTSLVVVLTTLGSFAWGRLLSQKHRLEVGGRCLLSGAPAEAALLAVAPALLAAACWTTMASGWAADSQAPPWSQDIGGGTGASALVAHANLLLVLSGAAVAQGVDARELEAVDAALGGVWVPVQLLSCGLFGYSSASCSLRDLAAALPMLLGGVFARGTGAYVAAIAARRAEACACEACTAASRAPVRGDALVCFLASLSRTVLPAVCCLRLGWAGQEDVGEVQRLGEGAARLYFWVLGCVGSFLLERFGPRLLAADPSSERCDASLRRQRDELENGHTMRQQALTGALTSRPRFLFRVCLVTERGNVLYTEDCSELPLKHAVNLLATVRLAEPETYKSFLRQVHREPLHAAKELDLQTRVPQCLRPEDDPGTAAGLVVLRRVESPYGPPPVCIFEATASREIEDAEGGIRRVQL